MSTGDQDFARELPDPRNPTGCVDIEGVVDVGDVGGRVFRRSKKFGGVATSGVTAVTAVVLAFAPGTALEQADLAPAVPPRPTQTLLPEGPWIETDATDATDAPSGTPVEQIDEYAIVAPDGRACGTLPRTLLDTARTSASSADLRGDTWLGFPLTPVGDAAGGAAIVEERVDRPGETRALRLLDLRTGALSGDVGPLVAQQSAAGQWDGARAVYGIGVMVPLQIWRWDANTNRRTLIGARDAQGWEPAGAPVLGSGVAMWAEQRSATAMMTSTAANAHRLVRYDLASGLVTILPGGTRRPVGLVGTDLWAVESPELPGTPEDRLIRIADQGSGAVTVVGSTRPGLQTASSDGRHVAWIEGDRLMVTDGRTPPRELRRIPVPERSRLDVSDGFVIVHRTSEEGRSVSVVVEATSGAATAVPSFWDWHGSVLTAATDPAGPSVTALNVTRSSQWRSALQEACRA